MRYPDFEVETDGSVWTLRPLTAAAREWLDEHVQAESYQWLSDAFVVEHRYIGDIVQAASDAGLRVRVL
jgi:hypothetical protein